MQELQMKRRFGDALMTEHERRVHDKDLQAYMEGDNQQLYNRAIPGIASSGMELKDKYLEKMFTSA